MSAVTNKKHISREFVIESEKLGYDFFKYRHLIEKTLLKNKHPTFTCEKHQLCNPYKCIDGKVNEKALHDLPVTRRLFSKK